MFFELYFGASTENLFSNPHPRETLNAPALIPQVWVNWTHYDSKDKERAEQQKGNPFELIL